MELTAEQEETLRSALNLYIGVDVKDLTVLECNLLDRLCKVIDVCQVTNDDDEIIGFR